MKIGFLVDPVESLKTETDTSLSFMDFSRRSNDEVYAFTSRDLFFCDGIRANLQRVFVFIEGKSVKIEYGSVQEKLLSELDICFLRKDPPFDDHYVQILQILSTLEEESKTLFINSPAGVLKASEKLYTLALPQYIPRSLISSDPSRIRTFIENLGQTVIIKPVNLFGSRGIERHIPGCGHLEEKVLSATQNGTQYTIVQEYLPGVTKGDKRVFLINGRICGAISRIPQQGEFRCAVGLGARVELCELSGVEREICGALAPLLKRDGLIFVGIDLIEEKLIEINVTSPTIVRQWNELSGLRMEKDLYEFFEKRSQESGN